jgi:hypothetical protein
LGSKAPRNCSGFLSAPRLIRTADLLIRSQTLYPSELWAREADRFVLTATLRVNHIDAYPSLNVRRICGSIFATNR